MTKGELLRLLEPLDDETEILVDLTQEHETRPIESIVYVMHPSYDAVIYLKVGQ